MINIAEASLEELKEENVEVYDEVVDVNLCAAVCYIRQR